MSKRRMSFHLTESYGVGRLDHNDVLVCTVRKEHFPCLVLKKTRFVFCSWPIKEVEAE
jgi:hypothetical protein